jgi:predicted ATPase/DNA-binding SARP family transcriptional activator
MRELKLYLLGNLQVDYGAERVTDFVSQQAQALLGYLAVTRRAHTRQALAGLLGGDLAEEEAKDGVRVALANLNERLPEHLDVDDLTVALRTAWLDLDEFTRLTATVDQEFDEDLDVAALQAALRLYRGDLLAGLEAIEAPEFHKWVAPQRHEWRQRAIRVAERLAQYWLGQRQGAAAVETLQFLLMQEPWHEQAHRQLMTLYARQGNFAAALAQYEQCQTLVQEQLGTQPLPETQALFARIQAAQGTEALSLPPEPVPLIGRQVELTQLANLLANPACRLITITGLGGLGKTRLAMAAAREANRDHDRHFLNGVVFVSLAGVSAATLLPLAVAEALGLALTGQRPVPEQVIDALRNQERLLVLDNFEHLLAGVEFVQTLLEQCPLLKVIVTSREPLQALPEWRFDLEGLPSPPANVTDFATITQADAVQLFLQAAQGVAPGYGLPMEDAPRVAHLCRMTGGSPLAITLAALWLRTLTVSQIVATLQQSINLLATERPDWSPRQRSIRAIFDYTYGLLDPATQTTFRRLAVFRGGLSEEAATQVAGATSFVLAELVDRGLLQVMTDATGIRYDWHELTRQFAAEQLAPEEADALCDAHAAYFADLLQRQQAHQFTRTYRVAVAAVEADIANVRAAGEWLIESVRQGRALPAATLINQMVSSLTYYFHARALWQPGRELLGRGRERLLAAGWAQGDPADPAVAERQLALARTMVCEAVLEYELGLYPTVTELLDQALPLLRRLGRERNIAIALLVYGRTQVRRGRHDQAEALLQEGLALCRKLGDTSGCAEALIGLGLTASSRGRYEQAQGYLQEALAVAQELGYQPWVARVLTNLGTTYSRQYDYRRALPLYEEALQIAQAEENVSLVMINESNIGGVLRGLGDLSRSERHYRQSLSKARSLNDRRWIAANLNGLAITYLEQYALDAAERALREALTVAHSIDSTPDTLGSISLLGHVLARRGRVGDAIQALRFVEAHPATMARDHLYNEQLMAELAEELPADVLAQAREWAVGKTVDEVVQWLTSEVASLTS